jgi:tetratricopeptide (TPR) repeat protein
VAVNKHQIEEEARRHLAKGNTDKAITSYAALLRQDPQDRRVRQKIAGLYQSVGRNKEAEKHFRELVKLYQTDGNERARMATLKQLRRLAPGDGGIMGLLAQAYRDGDLPHEAIKHYEQAINLLSQRQPKEASVFAQELQELKPGDTPLRLKTAELLAAAKDEKAAYKAYRELIDDLRRHGKLSEVGRVAAMALQIKPDETDLLCDAAEASLAGGEPQTALTQLQPAFADNPNDIRTLDLLAQVFEESDEPGKAGDVLKALARELKLRGDHQRRLSVIERAQKLVDDGSMDAAVASAQKWADAAAFRLGELMCAQPRNEDELRIVVRASVMLSYRLPEKAQEELAGLPKDSLAGQAWTIEICAAQGETSRAMDLCRALQQVVPPDEIGQVRLRLAVLGGQPLDSYLPQLEDAAAVGAIDDDELLDDDLIDDELLDDDLLDGDEELIDDDEELIDDDEELIDDDDTEDTASEASISSISDEPDDESTEAAAFFEDTGRHQAVAEEPDVFAGSGDLLGDLFGDLGPAVPRKPKAKPGKIPQFAPPPEDDFSAAMRKAPGGLFDPMRIMGRDMADDPLVDACALVDMGLFEHARTALAGTPGLRALAMRALCTAGLGDLSAAREELLDAVDDSEESDPELPAALFHLAALSARARKHRRAIRQLKEVMELAPDFRPVEVQIWLQTLEGLR